MEGSHMGRRLDLKDAALVMGTTSEALRKRAKRGTIPSEEGPDGKLYVWVDEQVDSRVDEAYTPELSALISELRDRIRFLEEESQRKDDLLSQIGESLALLAERVPQLEAPREPQEAYVTATKPEDSSTGPAAAEEPQRASSWWKRFFGFE
jgi:hypothetical protein